MCYSVKSVCYTLTLPWCLSVLKHLGDLLAGFSAKAVLLERVFSEQVGLEETGEKMLVSGIPAQTSGAQSKKEKEITTYAGILVTILYLKCIIFCFIHLDEYLHNMCTKTLHNPPCSSQN